MSEKNPPSPRCFRHSPSPSPPPPLRPCPALLPAGSARQVADREIPIVHRILKVHEKVSGEVDVLTKGDNNAVDDRGLYAAGQSWINKQHVIGRAKGYLPYIGMVTIIMNDYPLVKYALVGIMGLFVLTTRE